MKKTILIVVTIIAAAVFISIILSEQGTSPLWKKSNDFSVYSDPIYAGDMIYFLGGDKGRNKLFLYEVTPEGKIQSKSPQLPAAPYNPIYIDYKLILSDTSGMIRCFSVPSLNVLWEQAAEERSSLKPIPLDDKRILAMGSKSNLFCLRTLDGAVEWACGMETPIKSYGAGSQIVCIHPDPAFTDKNRFCATCLDKQSGNTLWRLHDVQTDSPILKENVCILTEPGNKIIIVDINSGKILYRKQKAAKPVKLEEYSLITYNKDSKELTVTSLENGTEWFITLEAPFVNTRICEKSIIIADKHIVQSRRLKDGCLEWERGLDDVYNLYNLRKGIFVTHKNSFTSRKVFGRFINVKSGTDFWTAVGSKIYMNPVPVSKGDFLVSSDGLMRLMPYIKESEESNSDFTIDLPGEGKEVQLQDFPNLHIGKCGPKPKSPAPQEPAPTSSQTKPEPDNTTELERKTAW